MRLIGVLFCLLDMCLHSVLIFGWVAITEIYKREGFFCPEDQKPDCPDQNIELSTIFTMSAAVLGVFVCKSH